MRLRLRASLLSFRFPRLHVPAEVTVGARRSCRASIAVLAAGTVLAHMVLAAGCVRLRQPAPAIQDYRLDYPPRTVAGQALPLIVRFLPLRVAAIYDREAIVYRDGPYSTGTYAYSRWSANPGSIVGDLLARDLAASGLYRAVQYGPSVLASDYQLSGEIQEIDERIAPEGCAAHLQLHVLLLQMRSGHSDPVCLDRVYAGDDPCACNNPRALAEAMSRVLENISSQLQQQVHDSIRTRSAAQRSSPARRVPVVVQ